MPTSAEVCVTIVTFNSALHIRACLQAVLAQEGVAVDVVIVDNRSTDGTLAIVREFGPAVRLIANPDNVGFAEAQNQAIRASAAPWVLTLNPDALLTPGFVRALLDAGALDSRAGSVCGKLLSIGPGFRPLPEPRIDSTGIYFTPAMRHFDRGWHEKDEDQFTQIEYVFGATAAAALYRREMIDAISLDGHFFDPDFFAYREDADVAWRAQLLGWKCIYSPAAVGYHVRSVGQGRRRSVAPVLNMHSVKNRFLMRIKNATPGLWRRFWFPMLFRDLVVLGGALLTEPASLAAFWHLGRSFRRALQRRRLMLEAKQTSDAELAAWFRFEPTSQPLVQVRVGATYRGRVPATGHVTVPTIP